MGLYRHWELLINDIEARSLDEPKKVKWTSNPSDKISRFEVCSSCWIGVKPIEDYYNYCPYCGKKWRKVDVY